jgi:hypothetical protein
MMNKAILYQAISYKPRVTSFYLSAFNLNLAISYEVPERSEWDQLKTLTLP